MAIRVLNSALVFGTRIVTVSLVDGEEEWFKMESGLGMRALSREEAFCGHAILQRGDEPMVVLDTLKDWRFRRNVGWFFSHKYMR